MNGFQRKMVTRAVDNSDLLVTNFDYDERKFIQDLNKKPNNYELSDAQNHWLTLIHNRVQF